MSPSHTLYAPFFSSLLRRSSSRCRGRRCTSGLGAFLRPFVAALSVSTMKARAGCARGPQLIRTTAPGFSNWIRQFLINASVERLRLPRMPRFIALYARDLSVTYCSMFLGVHMKYVNANKFLFIYIENVFVRKHKGYTYVNIFHFTRRKRQGNDKKLKNDICTYDKISKQTLLNEDFCFHQPKLNNLKMDVILTWNPFTCQF